MSYKKFGLITGLLVIFALGLLVLLTNSTRIDLRKAGADSGFDSSWDSGGSDSSWDSGSSWDSSSSWDSGGGSSSSGGSGGIVAFFLFIIIVIVVIALISGTSSGSKDSTNLNQTYKPTIHQLTPDEERNLNMYGYTPDTVLDAAYKAYVNIQYAWSDLDIDKAKDLLSDELYNTYKSQLNVLRAKKQKNVMKDFHYTGGGITSIRETGDTLTIALELSVTCKDYLVNSENNMTVRGNVYKTNYYTYSLTFLVAKKEEITNCPNCNAELKDGSSVKCEYCGSAITRKTNRLTLTRKEMIRQS